MKHRYLQMTLLSVCCLLLYPSCKSTTAPHRLVSVSILPQKYLIRQIAGDYLQVNVMIPPGMNPETCDLSTEQLKKLYDSDLCFTIGYLPFEQTHLYPVLAHHPSLPVISHSENITPIHGQDPHSKAHGTDGIDPHIWLSPQNYRLMAATVLQTLSEHYPEQAAVFRQNYKQLIQEIEQVDRQAREVFSRHPQKVFLIYHPALTYFADAYGLTQISIEEEGKEPHPAHLKEIINLAREKKIHLIFIQSQFDSTHAKAIAREIDAEIIGIDPLAENWTEELLKWIGIFDRSDDSSLTSRSSEAANRP